jgi:CheY-like chemotaxis protein
MQYNPIVILLVEDDPDHSYLIEKNLRRSNITNEIIVLQDGQQAVDFLFREGEYAQKKTVTPVLVLLDLNLPVLDGYQVLKRIKENENTKSIPVIILTTTDNPSEVSKCYNMGCNVYITKPVDYEKFSEAIRRLGLFVSIVKIPNEK